MSDSVNLHTAINTAMATLRPAPKPSSVTGLRHNMEAEKIIRSTLRGWGVPELGVAALLKRKTCAGGRLSSHPAGRLSAEGKQLTKMVLVLAGNRRATPAQKYQLIAGYAAMKPGRGGRRALEALANKPLFWSSLQKKHLAVICRKLTLAPSAAAAKTYGASVARLLDDDLFFNANSRGKQNALAQPARALKLLAWYKRSSVKIPLDRATTAKQARTYVKKYSGIRNPAAQKSFCRNMLATRDRMVFRFFENVPTHKRYGNRSVWYGEAYRKRSAFSWEQSIHEYITNRGQQERCALFPDRDKSCLK